VNHFINLLEKENLKNLLCRPVIACIGPITAQTAEKWGMKVQIQPTEYTIPGLTQAIVNHFSKNLMLKDNQ
jgi:uroporphyrinogen-III synthase